RRTSSASARSTSSRSSTTTSWSCSAAQIAPPIAPAPPVTTARLLATVMRSVYTTSMDIGLAMTARTRPDAARPLPEVYKQILDEAVLGEELGFDAWWLAEHHFAEDQHNPSQFPLLAAAATRTTSIRIGTFVLLLALHNPLLVAEDAATVDILSNGRL